MKFDPVKVVKSCLTNSTIPYMVWPTTYTSLHLCTTQWFPWIITNCLHLKLRMHTSDHTSLLIGIYRTRKIFGGGRFWGTIQVKAIGEEKFGE